MLYKLLLLAVVRIAVLKLTSGYMQWRYIIIKNHCFISTDGLYSLCYLLWFDYLLTIVINWTSKKPYPTLSVWADLALGSGSGGPLRLYMVLVSVGHAVSCAMCVCLINLSVLWCEGP